MLRAVLLVAAVFSGPVAAWADPWMTEDEAMQVERQVRSFPSDCRRLDQEITIVSGRVEAGIRDVPGAGPHADALARCRLTLKHWASLDAERKQVVPGILVAIRPFFPGGVCAMCARDRSCHMGVRMDCERDATRLATLMREVRAAFEKLASCKADHERAKAWLANPPPPRPAPPRPAPAPPRPSPTPAPAPPRPAPAPTPPAKSARPEAPATPRTQEAVGIAAYDQVRAGPGPHPTKFSVWNGTRKPIRVQRKVMVERDVDGRWRPLAPPVVDVLLTNDCGDRARAEAKRMPCLTLAPGAELTAVAWLTAHGRSQCSCAGCTPVPDGRYRIVGKRCGSSQRVEGFDFRVRTRGAMPPPGAEPTYELVDGMRRGVSRTGLYLGKSEGAPEIHFRAEAGAEAQSWSGRLCSDGVFTKIEPRHRWYFDQVVLSPNRRCFTFSVTVMPKRPLTMWFKVSSPRVTVEITKREGEFRLGWHGTEALENRFVVTGLLGK